MQAALNGGYHVAYLIGAGLVAVGILVTLLVLEPAPAPAMAPEAEADEPALERV